MDTDPATIASLLRESQRIIVFPNAKSNQDIIFAALALTTFLQNEGKSVRLVSQFLSKSLVWKGKIKPVTFSLITPTLLPQVAINVSGNNLKIDDIKLLKSDSGYKIVLQSKANIKPNELQTSITDVNDTYDLCIVLGSPVLSFNPEVISKKVLFISNQTLPATLNKTNNLYYKGSSKSFTIKIQSLFHAFLDSFTLELLTYLIAGIISYTAVFTKNVNKATLENLSELIRLGGDYHKAYDLAVNVQTLKKIKTLGKGIAEISSYNDGIYGCYYKKTLGIFELKQHDLFIFSSIYDCRVAFAFVEMATMNKVYLKTALKEIKLKRFLKQYQGKGSNYDGMILTTDTPDQFIGKLQSYLATI